MGAGVMGAQIAAHFANAGIPTWLFDLPSGKGDINAIARSSINALSQLNPSPLALNAYKERIHPANYDEHLEELRSCDLVIEAISERLDWKQSLFEKISPYLHPSARLASNTSGLSIEQLASPLNEDLRKRFLGVHFFNPPRYMKLVEVIPSSYTCPKQLVELERFLVSELGKGVVWAKDTPNFIGNRVGVFAILSLLTHAQRFNLSPDVVDALTGPLIGRPRSATFRTMDLVGLDTMVHVVSTMHTQLKEDPWCAYFQLPEWILTLVEQGALGQKTRGGIFKKIKGQIHVVDVNNGGYRQAHVKADPKVIALINASSVQGDFLSQLHACDHPQAQFLFAHFRDLFHYCAFHLNSIAHSVRDVDLAMRWGYGWEKGPFEIWQENGWAHVSRLIDEQIQAKACMVDVPLPPWVKKQDAVYSSLGAYHLEQDQFKKSTPKRFHAKQWMVQEAIGEPAPKVTSLFESPYLACFTVEQAPDIGIVSFKTKKNCISDEVLDGLLAAIECAQTRCKGLILWSANAPDFSVGADLKQVMQSIKGERYDLLENAVRKFQKVALTLKYCALPTVAAIRGRVLGGGCELALHTDRQVAALETYMGLVEIGVGLIPAGGGTKVFAQKAAQALPIGDHFKALGHYYRLMAQAKVTTSAFEAIELGFLDAHTPVMMNDNELLIAAITEVNSLAQQGYRPPCPQQFPVLGTAGMANIQTELVNWREGQFISDYDYELGCQLAHVLCGGPIEPNSLVDEQWVMDLEVNTFLNCAKSKWTHQRIEHVLNTGKPLRN